MSPVHLRNLGVPRNQPEDREGLSRTRRPERGHLGHSSGWQNTYWKDMDKSLKLHQLLKDLFQWSMYNKRFDLASHWEELGASFKKTCLKEIDFKDVVVITKGWNPTMQFQLLEQRATSIRDNQTTIQAIEEQLIRQGILRFLQDLKDVQESPLFTIPGSFQEKIRIQEQKQDLFQPQAEGVRPNDPETVGLGERSTQELEIVVNTFRISIPNSRNITPTQNEHSFVTPEINLNSDALCLQMSQFAEQTQKQFAEIQESHERIKTLTASIDKLFKNPQEGHAQLRKASEETNKR
ncbi:hypothetical protein O181_044378 [Austropuccinia psidii MF-1]|uniref:Uncharacterized protein n=1 Tax=Austropuccinia psidii MF-1 TaxID=1389203 RepID=A0A9Q3DN80_9BASI|nr:hypothetical protein [Austropuccinia psidii MF-1]